MTNQIVKDSNVQIIFYEANSNKQEFTNVKQKEISQLFKKATLCGPLAR